MFGTWIDILMGALWGFWLVMYLDRFYERQVAAINLCVFIFLARSFKVNRIFASAINTLAVAVFLFSASALFKQWVSGWPAFVAGWCLGYALYSFRFALPKQTSR